MVEDKKSLTLMDKIEETEQWLFSGDCSKCRREKYCSKQCRKAASRERGILYSAMASAVLKVLSEK